jgi:hypothetical protein
MNDVRYDCKSGPGVASTYTNKLPSIKEKQMDSRDEEKRREEKYKQDNRTAKEIYNKLVKEYEEGESDIPDKDEIPTIEADDVVPWVQLNFDIPEFPYNDDFPSKRETLKDLKELVKDWEKQLGLQELAKAQLVAAIDVIKDMDANTYFQYGENDDGFCIEVGQPKTESEWKRELQEFEDDLSLEEDDPEPELDEVIISVSEYAKLLKDVKRLREEKVALNKKLKAATSSLGG